MVNVEIHAGQLIGGEVTDGKSTRWWQKQDAPTDSSMLHPKVKPHLLTCGLIVMLKHAIN